MRALESLHRQILPSNIELEIYVVDDDSDDDTALNIRSKYQDVHLISGTGELYWAGGMRYGWENYISKLNFEYLFVFNDDIELSNDALSILLESAREVKTRFSDNLFAISGAFEYFTSNDISYGGFLRSSKWHPLRFKQASPTGRVQHIHTLNMNAALISFQALSKVGFLSDYFYHNSADIEFGLKLIKVGGSVWLSPKVIGRCDRNTDVGTSKEEGLSAVEKIRRLISIKEQPILQRWIFCYKHGGWFWPIIWISPYVKICVRAIFGK
jgi:GT2 family glycosyltransferase